MDGRVGRTASANLLKGVLLPIDRIEVFVTQLPQRVQRRLVSGIWDTGPATELLGKPVLVKVFADGIVGIGQVRPLAPSHIVADSTFSTIAAIREIYGPRLIGLDLFDHELHAIELDRGMAGNPAPRAVLDHALHDAMGKALGVPVYKLLGGLSQPRIPLEWSVGFSDKADDMILEARKAVEEFGLPVICLKAGHPRGWRTDVENIRAVRQALGQGVAIGVDPNEGWSVTDTLEALPILRELDIAYLEQPIARRNIAGLARIQAVSKGLPLMADESLFTLADAFELAEAHAVDVFCVKLYKVGGIRRARKIAAVAEAAQIKLNAGAVCAFSQLEAAASGHFYASLPAQHTLGAAEFVGGLGVFGPDPLVPEPSWTIVDGHVAPPSAPGLGVSIDERRLKDLALLHDVIE